MDVPVTVGDRSEVFKERLAENRGEEPGEGTKQGTEVMFASRSQTSARSSVNNWSSTSRAVCLLPTSNPVPLQMISDWRERRRPVD